MNDEEGLLEFGDIGGIVGIEIVHEKLNDGRWIESATVTAVRAGSCGSGLLSDV